MTRIPVCPASIASVSFAVFVMMLSPYVADEDSGQGVRDEHYPEFLLLGGATRLTQKSLDYFFRSRDLELRAERTNPLFALEK
jgi:hypothetical protein